MGRVSVGLLIFFLGSLCDGTVVWAEENATPTIDSLLAKCEYGITLALGGDVVVAESTFVSLLSDSPADARALNNLGNLSLMKGVPEVAIAFYDNAASKDSTDAGIVLNRATALMILGKEDEATREAARGVRMAGGVEAAAFLVGIHTTLETAEPGKGSDEPSVRKTDVLALIQAGPDTTGTFSDSLGGDGDSRDPEKTKKRRRLWRAGGARAAEGIDTAFVLYWKR